ncbi:MAG: PrsW family intramembrane metalloprotease [Pseudanabaena sp.]|nr:MAG: PrsW family intramembrane metalloprotease [Pseudanabaena sp.]
MDSQSLPIAFLKQIPTGQQQIEVVTKLGDRPMILGRDPSCDIAVDINIYASVSRRHAEIRPILGWGKLVGWEICDLSSANGTYVNEQPLSASQKLHHGDRIRLANSPQFVFELQTETLDTGVNQRPRSQITALTLTKLLPIFSTGQDLWKQAYLLPGIATVGFVVIMFASLGQPQIFNLAISAYISLAAYYFIYQLCGKPKPWWIIFGSALLTSLILRSPLLQVFFWFFYQVLPGTIPTQQANFTNVFIAMFFGAGLMEELLKALPIFLLWLGGLGMSKKWRSRYGISEPLDGILIGAASAIGFTLTETLGLYLPNIIQGVALQGGNVEMGELTGLQLLIPRVLGSVAGHMAYSGYFGYFIGLSNLKQSLRWQILAVGYLSSAFLHALWNTSALVSFWLLALVGGISYAFLVAAILKAKSYSKLSK